MKKTVIIIGAGITGLFTAIQLRALGYQVTIVEQAPSLRHEGGGLYLWAPAVALLTQAGFGEALKQLSGKLDNINTTLIDATQTRHTAMPMATFDPINGASNAYVARSELQTLLFSAVKDTVIFNKKYASHQQDDSGVTVTFEDGTKTTADWLIAADGPFSKVRNALSPQPLQYEGFVAVGGIIHGKTIAHQYIAALNRVAFIFPIANDRHYVLMVRPLPEFQTKYMYSTPQKQINLFKGWSSEVDEVLVALRETLGSQDTEQHYFCKEIYRSPTAFSYHDRNIVLLGESAHPNSPIVGLGTMICLQGVMSLVNALKQHNHDLPKAFAQYQAVQQYRVAQYAPLESTEITNLLSSDVEARQKLFDILCDLPAYVLYQNLIGILKTCEHDTHILQQLAQAAAQSQNRIGLNS